MGHRPVKLPVSRRRDQSSQVDCIVPDRTRDFSPSCLPLRCIYLLNKIINDRERTFRLVCSTRPNRVDSRIFRQFMESAPSKDALLFIVNLPIMLLQCCTAYL